MVELQHRAGGIPALQDFLTNNPNAGIADWGSQTFQPVKQLVKQALNQDQQGLCAYCERSLTETDGQIDHIKPWSKGGTHNLDNLQPLSSLYRLRTYLDWTLDVGKCLV